MKNHILTTRNFHIACRAAGLFFVASLLFISVGKAQSPALLVDSSTHLIDGSYAPYNQVHPGDTIFLAAGERNKLLIRNINGTPGHPIVFMNQGGIVSLLTNDYYGLSVVHCSYFRISGQGTNGITYGIQIKKVLAGAGIGIGDLSTDFELDHLSIENCLTAGIYAKTEPDCLHPVDRSNFTQYNTVIHDNYIAETGNEGMYLGSSGFSGKIVNCNGHDSLMLPPVLKGVRVYNNIITNTGWDGIQVSSAVSGCAVFGNKIKYDSQNEVNSQMSGILLGGGSKCDCYNNIITDGKGDGIENHGLGGNRIFNNIILNAGRSFKPEDPTAMKHGIFISDVSAVQDSSVYILFNDIINAKSDGIRFQSNISKNNLIASNLIINPGNFTYYAGSGTATKPEDAYVMIPSKMSDVTVKNNFLSQSLSQALISGINYTPVAGSPLINSAYPDNQGINFDFLNGRRPVGKLFDIGAIEYTGGPDTLLQKFSTVPLLFPNPVESLLSVRYYAQAGKKILLRIFNAQGVLMFTQNTTSSLTGVQEIQVNTADLPKGFYIYTVNNGDVPLTGKFIRL